MGVVGYSDHAVIVRFRPKIERLKTALLWLLDQPDLVELHFLPGQAMAKALVRAEETPGDVQAQLSYVAAWSVDGEVHTEVVPADHKLKKS